MLYGLNGKYLNKFQRGLEATDIKKIHSTIRVQKESTAQSSRNKPVIWEALIPICNFIQYVALDECWIRRSANLEFVKPCMQKITASNDNIPHCGLSSNALFSAICQLFETVPDMHCTANHFMFVSLTPFKFQSYSFGSPCIINI